MRDQFIAGLTSETLRVKLIGKGHKHRGVDQTKVTLREVVEVAKSFEATTYANQLMKTARSAQQEQVNFINKSMPVDKSHTTATSLCFCCRGSHPGPHQQHCPAFGKRCNKCGIVGHFARFCKGGTRRQGKQQQSNFVHDYTSEEAFAAECETTARCARRFFAHLLLVQGEKSTVVRAQIDSASTCNTMPSNLIRRLFPDLQVPNTKSRISTYGSQTMRPQGQVTLYCDRNGKLQTIDFFVVDVPGDKPSLLSGKDAQALGYLKIYADETNAVEDKIPRSVPTFLPLGKLTEKDILQHYSNIFKPGRGKPLGSPMHIELDPSVTPVHAPTRLVSVAKLNS